MRGGSGGMVLAAQPLFRQALPGLSPALAPPEHALLGPLDELPEDLLLVGRREQDRLDVELSEALERRRQARFVPLPALAHLARTEARVVDAARRGLRERHDDSGDVRKALLPERILDHDRNGVPTALA